MFPRALFVVLVSVCGGSAQPVWEPKPPDAKTDPPTQPSEPPRFRFGSDKFREAGYITAVALAPDAKTLAVCNGTLTVRILELPSGKEVRRFSIREHLRNEFMYFSPDGKQLYTPGYNGLYVWDAADGKAIKTIGNNNNNNRDGVMQISADGKWGVVGSQYENGQVKVIELSSGNTTATFKPAQNAAVFGAIAGTGETVATWGTHYNRGVAGEDYQTIARTVQIWNVKDAKVTTTLVTDSSNVQSARFSPDNKKLATAGNGVVQIWDVATGKQERRFAGRTGQGTHVLFSPDGKILCSAGSDGCVQTWEVATGKRLGIGEGNGQLVRGMQYRPDGQLLAWSWNSNAIDLWEAPSGKRLTPEGGHSSPVASLQFSADGKTLFSSSNDGRVLRWDTQTGKELTEYELKEMETRRLMYGYRRGYQGMVHFAPNGKYLISGTTNGGGAALWDTQTGMELFALTSPQGYVDRSGVIAFSPDSTKLVAATRYGGREQGAVIPLWDVETGAPLPECKGQKGDLTCGGFSTDGSILVMCSYAYQPMGGQIAEAWSWDVATGKNLAKASIANTQFLKIQFIDHRLFVALTSNTQAVKVFDAMNGQEVRTFEGNLYHNGGVNLALSPDRRLLAAGTQDGQERYGPNGYALPSKKKVVIWEVASGSVRRELTNIDSIVTALAFSADGKMLAVGCNDTTIYLWDLTTTTTKVAPLKAEAMPDDWKTLDQTAAKKADDVMRQWIAHPTVTLPFLKEQVKPIAGVKPDAAKIAKLIADLDAARYAVRESAMRDLERLGILAKAAIDDALRKNPPPEMRDRLEKLVSRVNKPDTGAEWIRPLRGIEMLERIGTPEAIAHLKELAAGGDAPPTRMAKEALSRLVK